jgi:hypothetical protein
MPKDEFDPEDPMELNGVAFLTEEDTTDTMCECFIEEFMRMGHGPRQVLALFRNPHYLGMNMVLEKRGEQFVRDRIEEIYARWGRSVSWAPAAPPAAHPRQPADPPVAAVSDTPDGTLTDPMGGAVPKFNL